MALTKTPIELSSTPGIVDNSNATAITIDASENVLVGKTTTGDYVTGIEMQPAGAILSYRTSGVASIFGRTDTGEITRFTRGTSIIGKIGTTTSAGGTRLAIGGTGDPGIIFAGAGVFPAIETTASDNTIDLGSANYRWKDIFLSGGVNFSANANAGGMTSELLDDYEEGAWTLASTTSGVTISSQSCRYTKVGRLVTLNGAVTFSALPSNISTQHFSGAPFNCWAEHSVGIVREASTTGAAYILQLNANNSTLGMNSYSGVANGSTRIFAVNESYNFSLTYTIA
jgi:hypothetical protein